jgi:hypothetical protein
MILDKLLEKKDIQAYIKFRTIYLKRTMTSEMQSQPPAKRESVRRMFMGRIRELEHLSRIIRSDIKHESIKLSNKLKPY